MTDLEKLLRRLDSAADRMSSADAKRVIRDEANQLRATAQLDRLKKSALGDAASHRGGKSYEQVLEEYEHVNLSRRMAEAERVLAMWVGY